MSKTEIKTVDLEQPIKRDGGDIPSVQIRKPQPGEMRGVKLGDLMQLDVETHLKVLPRVTVPNLTVAELEKMHGPDFLNLCSEVAAYFLTGRQKAAAGLEP